MTATGARRHLARAWVLAERGRHRTNPNPFVGCVLTRDDAVVGEGWTEPAGGRHAEIMALDAAGSTAAGATAWVTLEPCDHHGRTGPCSLALLEAGVRRVVIGTADPHREAAGGAKRLRDGGVDVELSGWDVLVRHQNEVFVTNVERGRPWVTLKLAATAAGDMVTDEEWITGVAARQRVHRLRAQADAVLVGSGTVLSDNPRLDVRDAEVLRGQPRPVVVDRRGRIATDARVVRPGAIIITLAVDERWRAALERAGAFVLSAADEPRAWLGALAGQDVGTVLAEPGPTLARALCEASLVDEVVLHQARGSGPCALPTPLAGTPWEHVRTRPLGEDVETILRPQRG